MKKSLLVPFIVSFLLALIPLFWLKPGWMDLGGDSSRLYFYDPINYLKSFPLYILAPTGTDILMIGHYLIPFTLLIFLFHLIFHSHYLVITFFNSVELVIAFFSVYLIVKELIFDSSLNLKERDFYTIIICTISGLFYTLSPFLAPNGWDKALVVHNQFFLNPLFFLLLLKYINTKKLSYLFSVLLISFIFAANFSPGPPFFSFFPTAVFYLLIYGILIKKIKFNYFQIFLIALLFICVQLFHLLPQAFVFLNEADSAYRQAAFTHEGKIDRGLGYFTSVAQTYKFLNNLTTIPQGITNMPQVIEIFWFSIPFIFLVGILLNKKIYKKSKSIGKNFFILSTFFLVTLFLVTAKVTDIGFSFYQSLFYIPGFSMFRNFLGQFSFLFIFFYSLILGYSLFYISLFLKRKAILIIFGLLIILFLVSSAPFIKGEMVNLIENKGSKTEVGVSIKMDPKYEKVLDYIRKIPTDGKFISFPFTEGGLQILAGQVGGAYQGPSMISYLTGKVDYAGRSGLYPFGELFLLLAKDKDYQSIDNLFSYLNIRYIFYNSDPYIFSDNFYRIPPYQEMQKYLPTRQDEYKVFLSQLQLRKKILFGDKYNIFQLNDKFYLSHIFVAKNLGKINAQFNEIVPPTDIESEKRIVFTAYKDNFPVDSYYVQGNKINYDLDYFRGKSPEISSDLPVNLQKDVFPLFSIPSKANFPSEAVRIYDIYFDSRFYQAESILNNLRTEPRNEDKYLLAYSEIINKIIDTLEVENSSSGFYINNEGLLRSILIRQKNLTENVVNAKNSLSTEQKSILVEEVGKIFSNFFQRLTNTSVAPITIFYSLEIPKHGNYDIYIQNRDILKTVDSESVSINSKKIKQHGSVGDMQKWNLYSSSELNANKNVLLSVTIPQVVPSSDSSEWDTLKNREKGNFSRIILKDQILQNYLSATVDNVSSWMPDSTYLISFDYKVNPAWEWKNYKAIVDSSHDGKEALLQIVSKNQQFVDFRNQPDIQIKNLSIIKVSKPDVILRMRTSRVFKKIPSITFTKINPTKYKIDIRNADSPYTLVFLEQFNRNWKLFMNSDTDLTTKISASYFNGEVQEGYNRNDFLYKDLFSTWFEKPIAEKNHFQVDGYANAWIINPKDTSNRKDYQLILEMTAQRVSYISFFISFIAVLICIILFFVFFRIDRK